MNDLLESDTIAETVFRFLGPQLKKTAAGKMLDHLRAACGKEHQFDEETAWRKIVDFVGVRQVQVTNGQSIIDEWEDGGWRILPTDKEKPAARRVRASKIATTMNTASYWLGKTLEANQYTGQLSATAGDLIRAWQKEGKSVADLHRLLDDMAVVERVAQSVVAQNSGKPNSRPADIGQWLPNDIRNLAQMYCSCTGWNPKIHRGKGRPFTSFVRDYLLALGVQVRDDNLSDYLRDSLTGWEPLSA